MISILVSFLALISIPIVVVIVLTVVGVFLRKSPAPSYRQVAATMLSAVGITVAITLGMSFVFHATGFTEAQFFTPSKEDLGEPQRMGFDFEELNFESTDGTALHGYFFPAQPVNADESSPQSAGTVIHFHGSTLNASATSKNSAWLAEHGFHVFAFDYRGYGKSDGQTNRKSLVEDGMAAIEFVCSLPEVDPSKVVLWGQSMGGQAAISAAVESNKEDLRGVISEATYASYSHHVKDKFARMGPLWLMQWSSWLVTSDAEAALQHVSELEPVPLLLVHGSADHVVMPYHSEWLFDKAQKPKEIWRSEGGGHLKVFATDQNRPLLVDYLNKAFE